MKCTIRYGHSTCRIEKGTLTPEAQNALSERLSYEPPGAKFMVASGKFGNKYGGKQWDGKKRLYHKGHRTFGTGLLSQVIETLDAEGYDIDITDKLLPEKEIFISPSFPSPGPEWKLRDGYQEEAVATAIIHERGMIKIATGGGKTVIAGHIISRLKTNTVFLVHTKDLLYQAYDTFASMFGKGDVGIVGDGKTDMDKMVVVCTIQTAARALGVDYEKDSYAEGEDSWLDKDTFVEQGGTIFRMLQRAGCVMVDECHRVAAPTAMEVLSAIKSAPYRFGFSASPWRDDGADIALESAFGDILIDVNASSLIDQGYLVRPYIRMREVAPGRFPKGTKYATVYDEYIIHNDNRNDAIIKDAVGKVKRGIQTMVLVKQINHGGFLASMLEDVLGEGVPFLSGKDDSDTRNSVIGDMRANTLKCLVATTIADEGLDIKPLGGLVLAGAGKSSTRALQRVGRVLRPYPGKQRAEVTDFVDNARFLLDHTNARLKMYSSEPNFVITDF